MKNLNLPSILISVFSLLLLSNSFAQEYTRWHLPEGAIVRFGKGRAYGGLTYFPDGTRLAVRTSIGTWIYDVDTGKELELLTGDTWSAINAMAFSPDGETVAITIGRNIHLLDAATRNQKDVLTGHTSYIYSLAFSPTGEVLVSGSRDTTVRPLGCKHG